MYSLHKVNILCCLFFLWKTNILLTDQNFSCVCHGSTHDREKEEKSNFFGEENSRLSKAPVFHWYCETSLKKVPRKNKIKQIYMLIVGILRRIGRQ